MHTIEMFGKLRFCKLAKYAITEVNSKFTTAVCSKKTNNNYIHANNYIIGHKTNI